MKIDVRLTTLALLIGLFATQPCLAEETWFSDFASAQAQAHQQHKRLLVDFTGSDWCSICHELESEVFANPAFKLAANNLILVRLDYPQKKILPAGEKRQNELLKERFKISGFPTVILLDADGHEVRRKVGFTSGSDPRVYLGELIAGQVGLASDPASLSARVTTIYKEMSSRRSHHDRGDWADLMDAYVAIIEASPVANDQTVFLAPRLLARARHFSQDGGYRAAKLLSESPNAIVSLCGSQSLATIEAHRTPLEMQFESMEGPHVDIGKMRGKVVLIDFGGVTHCTPCELQEPVTKEVYQKYHEQGFAVIGVAWGENAGKQINGKILDAGEAKALALATIRERQLVWPHYQDPGAIWGKVHPASFIDKFGVSAFPTYFLIDRNGLLVAESSSNANLEAVVRQHLGLPPLHSGDEAKRLDE